MIPKSEIEQRFKDYMLAKGYAKSSISSYGSMLKIFLSKHNDSVQNITQNQIISFLANIESRSKKKQMVGMLRILYKGLLNQKQKIGKIEYPRKEFKLPNVISQDQAWNLINQPTNLKHKAILYLLYTSGIRRSELLNLKPVHILSDRMLILVKGAKGNKDRMTILDETTLSILKQYFRKYRPSDYLFEGQFGGKYSGTSVLNIVKKAAKEIGIIQKVKPHTLRHSFATHLHEQGNDIRTIQNFLGHKSSKTTEIYTHVSTRFIQSIKSPISLRKTG